MAFKHKFSYEEKVKILSEYLDRTHGLGEVCRHYDIIQDSLKIDKGSMKPLDGAD